MKRSMRQFFLKAFLTAAAGFWLAGPASVFGQGTAPEVGRGAPQDWSHKHLIYSNPDTRDEAARKGTLAFEQWKEKNKDPRHAAQVAKKTRHVHASENSPFSPEQRQWADRFRRDPPPAAASAVQRDWSNVLGGATGVGHAGTFPAKYSFDINATPSCANDFVVYTTSSAGATSSGVFATQTGTFTGLPTATQTVTISHTGAPNLILTADATLNTGLNFQIGATSIITATNLANAIARNGGTVGVTATNPSNNVVRVTALTSGSATGGITLADTLTNFTWAGAMAGGTGAAGQPTIVAFNQLYKTTCASSAAQPIPATFWSYNTGTGAVADTSPVLSLDGTEVAFIQRTGTAASLVVLKWSSAAPGTIGAPTALANTAAASFSACAAPCMTVIALSGGPNNTNSSPYYDYTNDILYVGADNGTLHKFTGVFNGTPTEATAPWPVTVSSGNILTSPVYDPSTGLIFVGSRAGATGGQLHSVNATTGAVVNSGQLSLFASTGVADAPIVDSTAQKVYVFVGSDSTNQSAIYQFSTAATISGLTTPVVKVGMALTTTILYAGTFDNTYWASANGSNPSGNLYVCGSAAARRPALWKVPITNNVMGAPVIGPTLVSGNAVCSPVSEIMNGVNDYIYASVNVLGNKTGCTGACIYAYNLTGLTWNAAAVPTAGLQATGGTSGIIVDNISGTTGASQIYYSTLTSPGNAVQASQAGLQ